MKVISVIAWRTTDRFHSDLRLMFVTTFFIIHVSFSLTRYIMIVRFETTYEDGYWSASAIGYSIFTDGETFEELLKNIEEAVLLYFEDEVEPNEQITIQTQTTHQVHHVATSSSC